MLNTISRSRCFTEVSARRLNDVSYLAIVRDYAGRLQSLSRDLLEVQERERRHLATELHDEIGQLLTGLKLTLEMGRRLPPEAAEASTDEAQSMVADLMSKVRNLSLELRPSMLDDLGLPPTLLWHFERYASQTGVRVEFKQTGLDRRLPHHPGSSHQRRPVRGRAGGERDVAGG